MSENEEVPTTLELPEQERQMSELPATAPDLARTAELAGASRPREMGQSLSSDNAGGIGGTYWAQGSAEAGAIGGGMPQASAQAEDKKSK